MYSSANPSMTLENANADTVRARLVLPLRYETQPAHEAPQPAAP